ncbi:NADH-quinone oxidoreductase subunit C [Tessaracoccus sp. Z1128]
MRASTSERLAAHPNVEMVDAGAWRGRVAAARAEGFTFLANLTAVDDVGLSDHIRVLLWLENPDDGARTHLGVLTPRDDAHLPDVADLYPGAAWLQRQVHDFFGVQFDGADNRPLIHHAGGAPLRKDALLEPRQTRHWPGALEPGESEQSPGRRKLVPPGVPDPAVVADPAATPADIALSATGSRVRRVT